MTHRIFDEGNARHGVLQSLATAEQAWLDVNPFVIGDTAPAYRAWSDLERARVAAYDVGECCGYCGVNGQCDSRAVQIRRRERLSASGMGARGIEAMCRTCERSEEWKAVELVYRVANETGRVTVAQAVAAIERVGE